MGTIAQQWFNEGKIKGEIEGEIKGEINASQKVIIEILDIRFHTVPSFLIDKVKMISDLQILESLRKKALTVNSVAQFEAMIQ